MSGSQDEVASLEHLIKNLNTAIENKSDSVLRIVENVLALIKDNGIDSIPDVSMVPCVQLVLLLRWQSNDVVSTVANIFAEVAKSAAGRERLATLEPPIAQQLVNLLQQKSAHLSSDGNLSVVTQVCRALGNMCYESERGQKCVLDANGLEALLTVLDRAIQLGDGVPQARVLRSVIVGFLLNLTVSQADKHKMLYSQGGIPLLCRLLELDGQSEEGADTTSHAIIILGYLIDQAGGDTALSDKVCQTLFNVLSTFCSTSVEISEAVLELLHSHAEDDAVFSDAVKKSLAQAGLCHLLISLVEKHKPNFEDGDEDAQQLFKMATDLIVIVLNGDESMSLLYADGNGEVYRSMLQWVKSDYVDLQTTGVLAIGNFARCDTHCIKMVGDGVHCELLTLLKAHSSKDGDAHLQHAVLSALRNLAIPSPNKSAILAADALSVLVPMRSYAVLNVAFKLLATFRMLVDGQEKASIELGTNKELVASIVEWSFSDCHAGVQGEASRLLAWIIKNNRSPEVSSVCVECGALPPLVAMLNSEHAVMRNEALLALNIVSARQLSKAQPSLAEAKVGAKMANLLSEYGTSMEKPMLCNVLSLLGELVASDALVKHLAQSGVTESLSSLTSRKDISDLDALVIKLSTVLNTS